MTSRQNEFGQPIGDEVPGWSPRPLPGAIDVVGRFCRLQPLDTARHGDDLWRAYSQAADGRDWTYIYVGPFAAWDDFRAYLDKAAASTDPRHYAVIDQSSGRAVGSFSLMRVDAAHGVIEVGNVLFSLVMQRSPLSTEAHYLLMAHVFETLGYRRYEWKCDSLNLPSRKTAERLGFTYEGLFRQALVYKGRNRDTAWYSLLDGEWPQAKRAFQAWLSPENFDGQGRQRQSLQAIRAALKQQP